MTAGMDLGVEDSAGTDDPAAGDGLAGKGPTDPTEHPLSYMRGLTCTNRVYVCCAL